MTRQRFDLTRGEPGTEAFKIHQRLANEVTQHGVDQVVAFDMEHGG
jgi:hypothetical protein